MNRIETTPILKCASSSFDLSKKSPKKSPKNEETKEHEEAFWVEIGRLRWCDRSDRIITDIAGVDVAGSRLSFEEMCDIGNRMKAVLINVLEPRYGDNKALISHIIARGVDFYKFILGNPTVVEYLVTGSEYQSCSAYSLNE